jgi:uncharacterized membrane protein
MILVFVRAFAALVRQAVPSWHALYFFFLGRGPETVLIGAALWGYGALLTLLTVGRLNANRHYLVVVMPLVALWCARLVFATAARLQARIIIATLCVLQLALGTSVLFYIHDRQVIRGEYGATWQSQQN